MCVLRGYSAFSFSDVSCVFMSPHIIMFACPCMYLCVCACLMHNMFSTDFVHLVFVWKLECEETAEGCPTESAAFRKDARMSLSQKA